MRQVLQKAGLSVAEFASLVGVSRIAVHNWVAQRSSPHHLIENRVAKTVNIIERLIEKNKLPLSLDLDRDRRREKLAKLKVVIDKFTR